jgi:omega-6 fatty acid desaturase (delta-12 desaturase)
MGDIKVLTVKEYAALPWLKRMSYRLYRNPIVMFVIAPIFYFTVEQRLTYYLPRSWKKERYSVHLTNCMVAASIVLMCRLLCVKPFFMVHLPVTIVASSVGVWLFYVQHNFEQTYWQRKKSWNYWDAALDGSSYYHLPKVLQWFTASIGLHHIHHLDSRIPNYRLQECFDENPEMHRANRMTLLNSLKCIPLRLWDEDQQQMVGFSAARDRSSGAPRAKDRASSDTPGDAPAHLKQISATADSHAAS